MPTETVTCLQCENQVTKKNIMVDDHGQFPKLNLKAQQEGRELVEICNNCYETMTDKEEINTKSNVRSFL